MYQSGTPGDSKVWTGPTSGGIRNDEALRSYVHKRLHEAAGSSLSRSKRRRPREIEDILKDLPFDDRQLARFALQEGIEAIKELNLLKETLKGCPAIDFEALMEGRPVGGSNRAFTGALDEHAKVQLRHMLTRLKDNASLAEFGLLFDGVRLKMNYSPNRELIRKSEWQLLLELSGISSGSME